MPFMTIEPYDRIELLRLARESIAAGWRGSGLTSPPASISPNLSMTRATFVTLQTGDNLRGCCGSIEPRFALAHDVWRNAWASAFADPRFPALQPEEFSQVHVQISVLTHLEPIPATEELELLRSLRPGRDGLVLQLGAVRATFLPAVWQSLADPREFVRELKKKAGWPAAFWSPHVTAWRYETESFGETT